MATNFYLTTDPADKIGDSDSLVFIKAGGCSAPATVGGRNAAANACNAAASASNCNTAASACNTAARACNAADSAHNAAAVIDVIVAAVFLSRNGWQSAIDGPHASL